MIDFDHDTAFTSAVLDAIELRAKVALHNIANQNTPGFKRYEVRFEDMLKQATAEGKDPSTVLPVVQRDESGVPGKNNVSLLQEMSILDKSRLLQDLFTRRAGNYFSTVNRAIFGR
jgi:flagellar basal-body rod protein FlgB